MLNIASHIQKPGVRHGMGSPSKGTNPANTLIPDFQTPELRENKFMLFQATSFWYFVTAAL